MTQNNNQITEQQQNKEIEGIISKKAINKIVKELRQQYQENNKISMGEVMKKYPDVIEELSNYRSQFNLLLLKFRKNLDNTIEDKKKKENLDKTTKDKKITTSQRLKRMPTILDKLLNRQQTMKITAMQDIAGVRAVCDDMKLLNKLHEKYSNKRKNWNFKIDKAKDYIEKPKTDRYRGIHLRFKYNNLKTEGLKKYNGLLLELQIRTKKQHIWATTVELYDFVYGTKGQEYKFGRQDDKDIKEFFQYFSSAIALEEEQKMLPQHADTDLTKEKVLAELKTREDQLKIIDKLQVLDGVVKNEELYCCIEYLKKERLNKIYLILCIILIKEGDNIANLDLDVKLASEDQAVKAYQEEEKKYAKYVHANVHANVVLVSSSDFEHLNKLYANYSVYTKDAIKLLQKLIKQAK